MSLVDLPPELLALICESADTTDIPSLRLTSRAICSVANEYLLPEIRCFPHRPSLKRLEELSTLPASIRKGIKTLAFYLDLFEQDEDLADWNATREVVYARQRPLIEGQLFHASKQNRKGQCNVSDHVKTLRDFNYFNQNLECPYTEESGYTEGQYTIMNRYYAVFSDALKEQRALIEEKAVRPCMAMVSQACPNLSSFSFKVWTDDEPAPNGYLKHFTRALCYPHGPTEDSEIVLQHAMLGLNDASHCMTHLTIDEVSLTQLALRAKIDAGKVLQNVEHLHCNWGRLLGHVGP